jgi:ribonucrease Y
VLTYDLCRRITKRIEDDMEYPGTIKVTVIRETREIGVAK